MEDSTSIVRGERPIAIVDPDYEQLINTLIDKEVFFSMAAHETNFHKTGESNVLYFIKVRVKKSDVAETYSMLTKHSFEAEIVPDWPPIKEKNRDSSEKTSSYAFYVSERKKNKNSFFTILEACGIARDGVITTETKGFDGGKHRRFLDHRLTVSLEKTKKLASELAANDHTFAVAPIELESLVKPKKKYSIDWTPETLTLIDYILPDVLTPTDAVRTCKKPAKIELVAQSSEEIKNLLEKYRGRDIFHIVFKGFKFSKDCLATILEAVKGADLETKMADIKFDDCEIMEVEAFCSFLAGLRCRWVIFKKSDSIGKNLYRILQQEGIAKKHTRNTSIIIESMAFSMNFGQAQRTISQNLDGRIRYLWCRGSPRANHLLGNKTLLHPMKSFTNLVGEHEVVNSPLTDLIYTVDEEFNYTLTTIHKFEASTD